MRKIPTDDEFIRCLAQRMCLDAGDSWLCDDGAQDQWCHTAAEFVRLVNEVLADKSTLT